MNLSGDNTRLAVVIVVLTVLALSLGDALIKYFSAELVLWQIFVVRSLFAVPVLLAILRLRFASIRLIPNALGWTALRSLMLAFMWVAYYAALPHLPLTIAAATYYTLPIFITLFSALLVGEPVRKTGWFAIGLGFAGIILVLKPDVREFNFYALLPLLAAILFALAMILTRTKCRNEHPLILSGSLNVAFIVVGLGATALLNLLGGDRTDFLSAAWAPMGQDEVIAIAFLTAMILIGSIGAAIAYQIGRSSVVATFDFAYVGFAAIWGFLLFQEVPDASTIGGMLMIVIAGIIAVRQ